MNTNTGEIASLEEFKKKLTARQMQQLIRPVNMNALSPRVRAMVEKNGRAWISRNNKCPCGSGKRFKRCCMTEE